VSVYTLDKCLETICEPDLIFHLDKAVGRWGLTQGGVAGFAPWQLGPHAALTLLVQDILQGVVMGGMVLETDMSEVVGWAEVQIKLEKAEKSGSVWGLGRAALVWAQGREGLLAVPSRAVSAVKNINLTEIPCNISIKVPNLTQLM
ncbi:hypothetical protein ASZ78_008035, partial [Callipepla squamata]